MKHKRYLERYNMKKSFTLIEILIVLIIIGILVVAVIPRFQKIIRRSKWAEAPPATASLMKAARAYYIETGKWPVLKGQGAGGINDLSVPNPNDIGGLFYYESFPTPGDPNWGAGYIWAWHRSWGVPWDTACAGGIAPPHFQVSQSDTAIWCWGAPDYLEKDSTPPDQAGKMIRIK